MLNIGTRVLALVLVSGLLVAPAAWACSNMGPGKHVGVVTTSDPANGLLVIIDAESQKPIQFLTTGKLLNKVRTEDTVIVTFTTKEDNFIAKDVVVHLAKKNPMS